MVSKHLLYVIEKILISRILSIGFKKSGLVAGLPTCNNEDVILFIKCSFLQLQCCGIEGPKDWDKNNYFNCSSLDIGSREACGVPFSCCKKKPDVSIVLMILFTFRSIFREQVTHLVHKFICAGNCEKQTMRL